MRIVDASRLSLENGPHNSTLTLPNIAAGELCVLYVEPEDTSLEAVLAALSQQSLPVVIILPQRSWLFIRDQDFARLKETAADIVSFVLPRERMSEVGRLAYAQGFHFTSQLPKAEAAFFQRHQHGGSVQLTDDHFRPAWRDNSMQQPDNLVTGTVAQQQQGQTTTSSEPGTLHYTEEGEHTQQGMQNGGNDPVTPFPNTALIDEQFRPLVPQHQTKKWRFLSVLLVVSLLVVVSAALLPSLLAQPASSSLTIPHSTTIISAPAVGSVGNLAFSSSGQLNPNSSTGLNDILTLHLVGLAVPQQGQSDYVWMEADKTQDNAAPILLGTLHIVGGDAQLTYQDKHHANLLVTYSRLLVTQQASGFAPNLPPIDSKSWLYQAGIPDVPTPGDEKGYSLLSHMRHLLASDPTLVQLGLQGGLDIWLYRNIGKILEWSNAARDDWAGNNVDLTRRQVDRIVQYLDGQVYAFRDLPAGTPWLVDAHAGRPGLIDFDTMQDEQGPPSYISHVKLHLMGMVNAPGHTAAQQQRAARIDDALTAIEALLKHIRSDAVQLAKMSDVQFGQQNALSLLNDMLTTANTASVGQIDPTTGAVQAGEVWVHDQMQSIATMQVVVATADGP